MAVHYTSLEMIPVEWPVHYHHLFNMFSMLRLLRLLFILFLTATFLVWFAWPSLLKYRDYPHPTIFTSKTVPFLANQTSTFLPTVTIGAQIT